MRDGASVNGKFSQSGSTFRFFVHLLKITRIPISSLKAEEAENKDGSLKRDTLRVTALFNSKQQDVGEFQITLNDCIIDRQLICQLTCPKSKFQSKLHIYIDQACSSGLAGHVAVDLKKFIEAEDVEVYVKYPLYATANHSHAPMLKISVCFVGTNYGELGMDEVQQSLVLQPIREQLPEISNRFVLDLKNNDQGSKSEVLDSISSKQSRKFVQKEKFPLPLIDETRLLRLEEALSKLKSVATAYNANEHFENRKLPKMNETSCADWQEPGRPPLGSEKYDGFHGRSQMSSPISDYSNSYYSSKSSKSPFSTSRHMRCSSDIHEPNQQHQEISLHERNTSIDNEIQSDFPSHTNNTESKFGDGSECFVCSASSLQKYRGLYQGVTRTNSDGSRLMQSSHGKKITPKEARKKEEEGSKKKPGLFQNIFGAVIIAGVYFLGARSARSRKKESQATSEMVKSHHTPAMRFRCPSLDANQYHKPATEKFRRSSVDDAKYYSSRLL